uniref:Uncharacterized protein n=1 Tax=Arundo donax TaxID=35708 RepID=A0A0A9DSR0_ARUDO
MFYATSSFLICWLLDTNREYKLLTPHPHPYPIKFTDTKTRHTTSGPGFRKHITCGFSHIQYWVGHILSVPFSLLILPTELYPPITRETCIKYKHAIKIENPHLETWIK